MNTFIHITFVINFELHIFKKFLPIFIIIYLFIYRIIFIIYVIFCIVIIYIFLSFILFLLCKQTTRFFANGMFDIRKIFQVLYRHVPDEYCPWMEMMLKVLLVEYEFPEPKRRPVGFGAYIANRWIMFNRPSLPIFSSFSFSYFRWSNELAWPHAITFHCLLRLVSIYIFFIRYNGGLDIFTLRFCHSINPGMKRVEFIIIYKLFNINEKIIVERIFVKKDEIPLIHIYHIHFFHS